MIKQNNNTSTVVAYTHIHTYTHTDSPLDPVVEVRQVMRQKFISNFSTLRVHLKFYGEWLKVMTIVYFMTHTMAYTHTSTRLSMARSVILLCILTVLLVQVSVHAVRKVPRTSDARTHPDHPQDRIPSPTQEHSDSDLPIVEHTIEFKLFGQSDPCQSAPQTLPARNPNPNEANRTQTPQSQTHADSPSPVVPGTGEVNRTPTHSHAASPSPAVSANPSTGTLRTPVKPNRKEDADVKSGEDSQPPEQQSVPSCT